MVYFSVNYNYSPDFKSPESWFIRTRSYIGILECLAKKNTVITIKQIDFEGICLHNKVQHQFVNFGKRKTYFPLKLNKLVSGLKPDIIILQGLHHPIQFLLLKMILPNKVRIIAQHHAEKPFTGFKKQMQRIADQYIDAYLFTSQVLGLDWVKQGVIKSRSKIHEVMEVSSVFYPIQKTAAKLKTGAIGQPVFLWVGRLNANKDPLNTVNGFLKFVESEPSATLYMIYHTDELLPDIIELLNVHPCQNAITLVGKIPNDEMLQWYNSADFIISGSHYEGSGTAICEAMSCGCVPVVTDIPSFRMITDNGQCGILYEPGNKDALFVALQHTRLMDMSEKRNKCIAYFDSHLSFNAIAGRIAEIAEAL
jgi:glycosyltransferase involved in cell wall biosynthesis